MNSQPPIVERGTRSSRVHALDALRGIAMALGLVLHGAVCYMSAPMPDLLWPAMDESPSAVFDGVFWYIHSFRIPLFFLIAGFFAMMLYEMRGWRGFASHRARRIGLPFILACAIVLPIAYFVWCWGWWMTGRATVDEILAWKFADAGIQNNYKGPAHLWFLEYLLFVYVAFLLVRPLARMPGRLRRVWERVLFSPWRPLIFAIPTASVMTIGPGAFMDFHNSFIPRPLVLLYCAIFFTVGCTVYPYRSRLSEFARGGTAYLIISIPLFAILLGTLMAGTSNSAPDWMSRIALGSGISLLAWLGVWGWLGVFMRWFSRESAALRYIADSSYWIYLVHLPLIGLLQIALLNLPIPGAMKFIVVVAGAFAAAFASYHLFVRRTAIGVLLNGRKLSTGSENRRVSPLRPAQPITRPPLARMKTQSERISA